MIEAVLWFYILTLGKLRTGFVKRSRRRSTRLTTVIVGVHLDSRPKAHREETRAYSSVDRHWCDWQRRKHSRRFKRRTLDVNQMYTETGVLTTLKHRIGGK